VDFYIMMGRAGMTMAQFNKFKAAIGWDTSQASGNFRPPQPLNGRAVSGCDSIALPYMPQTPVVAAPIVEEESCPSQAPLITLQAIAMGCVVLIFLVVARAIMTLRGSKSEPAKVNEESGWGRLTSPGWDRLTSPWSDSGQAQMIGKPDMSDISGKKEGVEINLAKLQEDLKALTSGSLSIMQARSEENGRLVNTTMELAKEIEEIMKGLTESKTKKGDANPASSSMAVDAHDAHPVSNSISVDAHVAQMSRQVSPSSSTQMSRQVSPSSSTRDGPPTLGRF